jgi:putative Holliday junction resolvase
MRTAYGYVLAFDFGLRHIGVAVGQTVTGTATPLTTLAARNGKPDWAALSSLVDHWRPAVMLVGLPLNMDGSESDMSARARRFADRLATLTEARVELVDERLTSHAVRAAGPQRAHEEAAVLIAESWLGDAAHRDDRS